MLFHFFTNIQLNYNVINFGHLVIYVFTNSPIFLMVKKLYHHNGNNLYAAICINNCTPSLSCNSVQADHTDMIHILLERHLYFSRMPLYDVHCE